MENCQLTWVILASALAGALLPLLVLTAIGLHRAGKELTEIGAQLKRTLTQFEVISDRVETLSRGLKGGETSIAELLTSVGRLASGLERNMNTVSLISTIVASVGTSIAAFVKTRLPGEEAERPISPDIVAAPEGGAASSPSAASPEAAD
ncbi:MAG: hypothetical protein HY901_27555 [Deltaproteobacteria bacterium]|nr:hypothetical protein [Deltaproteobacteria bacterium]